MNQEKDLLSAVRELVDAHFSDLRRTVRKNLARLTCAFLHLAWSIRFGYGGLHLTSIARVLPEGKNFKSSYKWLARFLKCKYFDASSLAECMLAVILGNKPPGWVIVLVDQTTVNGVEVVNAAIPFQGRAVPVAWVDFEYPWKTVDPASQNTIERYLLTWLGLAVPRGVRLILIFDRGYARVELIKDLNHGQQPFLIRGRRKVIVQTKVRGRQRRLSLGRLPHRMGRPLRYRHVLYHSREAEPVDVIVYRGKGFQEPWFLIVPPDSEAWLPTEEVVRLYRQRMQIEQCFRDWKSHLGLRGLRAAGFRSLAPHRRSSPAVSATHANRAVFSRLEKPPGAARLAPAGAKTRAPAAGADGIHPRLFDRSAVRDRSVGRKAPPLL